MPPGGPSLTARWVASHRARLSRTRPTVPGGDPGAEAALYAGLSRRLLLLPGMAPTGMATRTAFFDKETVRALEAGIRQVVILGAGYDGRALRFGTSARWIEIDRPSTQADKRQRISSLCGISEHIVFAPVDLLMDDLDEALGTAGHRRDAPTLFLAEGLFAYLPTEVSRSVCSTLRRRAAPGSILVSNYRVTPSRGKRGQFLRGMVDALLMAIGERRQADFHEGDPQALLASAGWQPIRMDRSTPNRVDEGSYLLVLATQPKD